MRTQQAAPPSHAALLDVIAFVILAAASGIATAIALAGAALLLAA